MSNKKKKKSVAKNNEVSKNVETVNKTAGKKVEESRNTDDLDKGKATQNATKAGNYEESQDVQLTVFTVVTAFSLLLSAFAALAGGGAIAKPFYFIAEAIFGNDEYDFGVLGNAIFEGSEGKFKTIFIISFVALVVALIMIFFTVIRAMKPENKPNVLVTILAFLVSTVAAVLAIYFFTKGYSEAKVYFEKIEHHLTMNWMLAYIALTALNAIGALVSVFASLAAYSKWEQEGKAY